MPDNNALLRSTIARQAAGVFAFQFTSTLMIAGRVPSLNVMLVELSESDKLEIAGIDHIRAQNVMILATNLVGVNPKTLIGKSVVLDGDRDWRIKSFRLSADAALFTFLLIDSK